jgi:hypothetical protein
VKHDKDIAGSKIKVVDLHSGTKAPVYTIKEFPGQFISKITLLDKSHLFWMTDGLTFHSAELKVNGKKTVLGQPQEWSMIN